jgi:hypothetical protein
LQRGAEGAQTCGVGSGGADEVAADLVFGDEGAQLRRQGKVVGTGGKDDGDDVLARLLRDAEPGEERARPVRGAWPDGDEWFASRAGG